MTILYNQSHLRACRRKLRKHLTKSEVILWKELKGSNIGYKFRRQYSIGNYILDFYSPILRLAIELDGYTHLDHEQWKSDSNRTMYLQEKGVMVLRFSDKQILDTLPEVLQRICATCNKLQC